MGVIDLSIIDIDHAVQILLTRSLTPQICLQQYAGIFVETFRDFLLQRAAPDLREDLLLSVGFLFIDRPDELLQILPVLIRQLRVLNPSAYAQQVNASDPISCRLFFQDVTDTFEFRHTIQGCFPDQISCSICILNHSHHVYVIEVIHELIER